MSAEALFKRLDRKQKDQLLSQVNASTPFEDILQENLPGFGHDTAREFVCRELCNHADPTYRQFHVKLIPNVDARTVVGVRTPDMRAIAKQLVKRDDANAFFKALPHRLYEENQVHALAIGLERDYATAVKRFDAFLPYVDNWATCDQLPTKTLAKQPQETLSSVSRWVSSGQCYTIRFGLGVLMKHFLDELFEPRFLDLAAATRMPSSAANPASEDDIYYVDMMRAWFFAEALAKQPDAALPYFEQREGQPLDEWTRRKAIQKAIESRRIPDETKALLRKMKGPREKRGPGHQA